MQSRTSAEACTRGLPSRLALVEWRCGTFMPTHNKKAAQN
jgi:hypothetical protein